MSCPLEFTLNGRPVRVEGVSPNTTLLEFFARQRADRLEGRLRRGRLRRVLRRHCRARRGRQTGVSNQQSPAIVVREFRSGINHGEFHERGGNVCKRKLPKRLGWFLKSRGYRMSICCGGLSKQCLPFGPFAKNSALDESIGLIRPPPVATPPRPPAASCTVIILISLSRRLAASSTHQALGRRASASVFRDVGYCRQARRRLPFGFGQVVGQDDSGATLNSHK